MEEHKKRVEQMIIDTSLNAFENKEIPEEELPKIADLVLQKMDSIQDHQQLITFLSELAGKWPLFKNIFIIEQGEENRVRETQAAKQVLNLIQQGRIKEAINLARRVN